MTVKIDIPALKRLGRQPTFRPADCPNYIEYRQHSFYKWYARSLIPFFATGGGPKPLFIGKRVETVRGESPGEVWMVVRYRSHRAVLKMIANPYYVLVCNPLRERGTARLELAFTEPRDPKSGLQRCPDVLGVHVRARDDDAFFAALRTLAESAGLRVVYESELRYDFDFIKRPRPFDPNPLTYPTTVALAGEVPALRSFAADPALNELLDGQEYACVQLYQREAKFAMLKFG